VLPSGPDAAARPEWLRRHHLVWIAPARHAAIVSQIADAALAGAARRLLREGAPLVISRQPPSAGGAPGGTPSIAAGLPLPPALGKRRLALNIPPDAIVRTAPPPALADAIARLPPAWRPPLLRLLRGARSRRIEFRLYGSAAWEALTGEHYLAPESDIDLLWRPAGMDQLGAGIALLADWERASALRADGEILFGDDDAVAWREWMEAQCQPSRSRVLVKSLAGARLCMRADLLARAYSGAAEAARCNPS
jgi:phosphoribosyl-dephospho-CoA transferase